MTSTGIQCGLYIIAIASSANHQWPWSQAKTEAEALPLFKAAFPAICSHLEPFAEGLRKRDDQGRFFWELRSCAYYGEFEEEKILYAEISTDGKFLLDQEKFFCDTTAYIMSTDSKFLLAVLNSSLLLYMFAKSSSEISGGFFRWKRQYIEQLPIPDVPPKKQAPIVALVEQILAAKKSPVGFDSAQPTKVAQPTTRSLSGVEGNIPALEAGIDRLVYALYNLTDDEIAVVEGKNEKHPAS